MKKNLLLILLFLIMTGVFFFRVANSYRMPPSYNYDSDFGRDLLEMYKITKGHFTLIGPKFSFSGLHLGPYHYYLFAPFLFLGNYDFRFVVFANCLVFLAAFLALFWLWAKKDDPFFAFLSVLWIITTPYILLSARTPGNAFSYLPFLFLYLIFVIKEESFTSLKTVFYGFLAGLIVNIHPSTLPIIFPVFLAKKKKFLFTLIFLGSFLLTFSPVLLFNLRHDFVIFKNIFGVKTYEQYFQSQGVLGGLNLGLILALNKQSVQWIPTSLLLLLALFTIVFFSSKKDNRHYRLFFVSIFTTAMFFIFGRAVPHYIFPFIALLQVYLIFLLAKNQARFFFIVILLFLNLFYFPKGLYKPARNLGQIEVNFNQFLTKTGLPKENLNIMLVNETPLSIVGYEYRFLLAKKGYQFDDEFSYQKSKYLLVISEKGEIDPKNFVNLEWQAFGQNKLVYKTTVDDTAHYLFEKVNP